MPERKADIKRIQKKSTKRPSLDPHRLAASFLPCDAQPCYHERPETDHPCRTENDITSDNLPLFQVFETGQAPSSSSLMGELTHAHQAVHSIVHLTNSRVTCHIALDNEHRPTSVASPVDHQVKQVNRLSEQFNDATQIAAESPLLRWAHETNNSNITFAERLEKSKWEESRFQKL